jgi:hypothetical protein
MTDPDDLRAGLADAASSIDPGDLDATRASVHTAAARARVRTRAGVAVGLAAVVAVGAGLVAALAGSGARPTLVSTDSTVSVDQTEPAVDETEPATVPSAVPPVADAPAVEVINRQPAGGSTAGERGAPARAEDIWATPWRDGFLVVSLVGVPQALPTELPPDVEALFPHEVLDLFAEGAPATVTDAAQMLSDAGLLDEVSTIIAEHPEASAAIYGTPSEPPTADARFTVDGTTWEPIEMMLPPDARYISSIVSVGDRLAVVVDDRSPGDPVVSNDGVTVAWTTDLVDWATERIEQPSALELPTGVRHDVWAQGLVANESGWAVTVYDDVTLDALELVRAAGLEPADLPGGNYGETYDATGVELQYDSDGPGPVSPTSVRYSWDELGVSPAVAALLTDNEDAPQVWASPWDGAAARSDAPPGSGRLLATPAGFLQWSDHTLFSEDGLTWTASPLPDDDGQVMGAFTYDGGVIALSRSASGTTDLYRLDEAGGSAELLDVPGLPANVQAGFESPWSPGSAIVVNAASVGTGEIVDDLWLIGSVDGAHLVVADLDDSAGLGGPMFVTTNGDRALVLNGEHWVGYPLR